jgi:hypothetical protein
MNVHSGGKGRERIQNVEEKVNSLWRWAQGACGPGAAKQKRAARLPFFYPGL